MQKEEIMNKIYKMYENRVATWDGEVSTLEEIHEEVLYILEDYEDVPDAPHYTARLVIDKNRVYADTVFKLLTTFKVGYPPLFFDVVVRQFVLHSIKHYRGWVELGEEVDKLEQG